MVCLAWPGACNHASSGPTNHLLETACPYLSAQLCHKKSARGYSTHVHAAQHRHAFLCGTTQACAPVCVKHAIACKRKAQLTEYGTTQACAPVCANHIMACRMKALLTENGPTKQGTRDPSQTFLGRNTLADLFYLLRLEVRPAFAYQMSH